MSQIEVGYDGRRVGILAEARGGIFFEYDPAFIASGEELSPLHLPLRPGLLSRDATPTMRLPGLFEDSLPDLGGRRLMAEWFRREGVREHAITPLMMLAYVGRRAMGALTYQPPLKVGTDESALQIGELYTAAARAEKAGPIDLDVLAPVGSSVGGAKAKALIGLPKAGAEGPVLPGGEGLPPSHEAWLVKFDTSEDGTAGPMEEAFARLARAAGIEMPQTRLLSTRTAAGTRRHFAVKRFDRLGPKRLHYHSLAGLCQMGNDLDYGTLLRVARRLTRSEAEVKKAFRRAVFNVLASNRDDHGKNHGFLYRDREWVLAPAFDLTFSSREQLPERGMAVLGERREIDLARLRALAESEDLDRAEADAIIDEVRKARDQWPALADEAGVPKRLAREIA